MAGIYLHIPFCKQACTYCNFHFSTLKHHQDDMILALQKEIRLQENFFIDKTTINTLYFGGGTPSLLKPSEIQSIIEQIKQYYTVSENIEITLEANPDDLTGDYLDALKSQTEVNRLSIGVQSFFDEDLKFMKRAHNAREASNCIILAQQHGFRNLSVDLIYGTPTLSDKDWKENLKILFELNVQHISAYALTVEEKTELFNLVAKKKLLPPSDEQTIAHFSILLEEMSKHNYIHYEISNFCKESYYAQHNTNYWKGIPYLGLGPSAHSFDGNKRYWNIRNNGLYLKAIAENSIPNEYEILNSSAQYNEYVMTSIRTIWGTDKNEIRKRFGDKAENHFSIEVSPFISNGWINEHGGIYTLTASGKLFCDYITENLFISEEDTLE